MSYLTNQNGSLILCFYSLPTLISYKLLCLQCSTGLSFQRLCSRKKKIFISIWITGFLLADYRENSCGTWTRLFLRSSMLNRVQNCSFGLRHICMIVTISFSPYLIFRVNFIHKTEKVMTLIGSWK